MSITMTIEVTPEQAVRIAEILKEPASVQTRPTVPAAPAAMPQPAQQPVVSPAPVVPVQSPVAPAPAPAVMPSAVPTGQPIPTAAPVPSVQPAAPAMAAPPTTARKYTMDELSLASRPLVEAGRQQELLSLLHSFTYTDPNGVTRNVVNLRELPEELYPAFANGIRQLGGRI